MKRLVLCAGHYLGTEGRRCLKEYDPAQTQEWELNRRVADRVEKLLDGYDVIILRVDDVTGKEYRSVNSRVEHGNEWEADFWLGIHHNAGINGGKGGGISAYVYTEPMAESIVWQKKLYDNLIALSPELKGNRATPLSRSNLAECRDTEMPSVLLELGFMDSPTDIPYIITDDHADKCARAIASVIVDMWGLGKLPEKPPEVVYYGGALYIGDAVRTPVYDTSKLENKIGSLDPHEVCNVMCSVGNTFGVLYNVSDAKKLGFIKRT